VKDIQAEHKALVEVIARYSEFITALLERKKIKERRPKAAESV
jgi:hypothetical protein